MMLPAEGCEELVRRFRSVLQAPDCKQLRTEHSSCRGVARRTGGSGTRLVMEVTVQLEFKGQSLALTWRALHRKHPFLDFLWPRRVEGGFIAKGLRYGCYGRRIRVRESDEQAFMNHLSFHWVGQMSGGERKGSNLIGYEVKAGWNTAGFVFGLTCHS